MANDIPEEQSDTQDPSQYIRTYAKDMAALAAATGTTIDKKIVSPPAPTHGRIEAPKKATHEKKSGTKKSGVVFSENPEGDFFHKPVPRAEQGDAYQEPISLPSVEEAGSIMEPGKQEPNARTTQEDAPPIPLMPKAPQEQEPLIPAAERESVLARLRARVSRDAQMDIQTPRTTTAPPSYREPLPEPPPEPVIAQSIAPEPAPAFEQIAEEPPAAPAPSMYREPIEEVPAPPLPPSPEPIPAPAPFVPAPYPEVPAPENEVPARFHTYTTDFADRIDDNNASTFSVLAAQADAGRISPAPAKPKARVPWIPILVGVVLIVGGGAGLFTAYTYVSKLHAVPVAAPSAPSLIFVDSKLELKGSGSDLINALANASNQPLGPGKVLLTYITESTTTGKGLASFIPASGGTLIAALQLPAPDILLRNIDETSTVGIVHAGNEEKPFFILRVSSYERTLAGMLTWEPVMWTDLAALYPLYPPSIPAAAPQIGTSTPATASSTASTTIAAPVPTVALARAVFDDEVVASHDARVLRDTSGNTLLIYGYYDKETLIIARDEAAFTELINRLSATKVQ